MDAIECLKKRRSCRKYLPEPIHQDVIMNIIDCARLAPTGRNAQPWEFVVVTEPAAKARIAELATYGKFLAHAPVVVVILCKRESDHALEDGSAAATTILNAAKAHNLGSCWVAGWDRSYSDDVVRLVGGDERLVLVALIGIGKSDPLEEPQPPKRQLSEVLHWGTLPPQA
jgi:nitroreductase